MLNNVVPLQIIAAEGIASNNGYSSVSGGAYFTFSQDTKVINEENVTTVPANTATLFSKSAGVSAANVKISTKTLIVRSTVNSCKLYCYKGYTSNDGASRGMAGIVLDVTDLKSVTVSNISSGTVKYGLKSKLDTWLSGTSFTGTLDVSNLSGFYYFALYLENGHDKDISATAILSWT